MIKADPKVDPSPSPRMFGQSRLIPLVVFFVGCLGAVVVWIIPAGREAFLALAETGYVGAVVAGTLYAIAFTSTSATILFFLIPESTNPIVAALLGGAGALAYDAVVFSIARFESHQPWYEKLRQNFSRGASIPNWLKMTLGAVILASPLPDELAAGLLGFSNIRLSRFILFSFILNTLGILAIIGIGRSGA